uniref:Uncharacterized protein n=1 Tax=Cacopsylla melanoneura TaxID=428564 RepID=A0A8D9ASU9_9HEMI
MIVLTTHNVKTVVELLIHNVRNFHFIMISTMIRTLFLLLLLLRLFHSSGVGVFSQQFSLGPVMYFIPPSAPFQSTQSLHNVPISFWSTSSSSSFHFHSFHFL